MEYCDRPPLFFAGRCFAGSILYRAFFRHAVKWKAAKLRIDKSFPWLKYRVRLSLHETPAASMVTPVSFSRILRDSWFYDRDGTLVHPCPAGI